MRLVSAAAPFIASNSTVRLSVLCVNLLAKRVEVLLIAAPRATNLRVGHSSGGVNATRSVLEADLLTYGKMGSAPIATRTAKLARVSQTSALPAGLR